jgi:hypothetical protein
MKPLLLALTVVLVSCDTPPIQVTPMPDVAAIRVQNDTTKKHITRTRQHIEKSEEAGKETGTDLQGAKKDLEDLLGK